VGKQKKQRSPRQRKVFLKGLCNVGCDAAFDWQEARKATFQKKKGRGTKKRVKMSSKQKETGLQTGKNGGKVKRALGGNRNN